MLERRHIADNTPGWRWCLAPGCRAGQLHEVKAPTNIKPVKKSRGKKKDDLEAEPTLNTVLCVCRECGAKACVTCERPWHEGETCEEFQLRTKGRIDEEDKTLAVIRKTTKSCPSCKKPIEKNGGCPAMYCKCARYQYGVSHALIMNRFAVPHPVLLELQLGVRRPLLQVSSASCPVLRTRSLSLRSVGDQALL